MSRPSIHVDPLNVGNIRHGPIEPLEAVEYDKESQAFGRITRTELEPEETVDVDAEEKARPNGKPQHAGFWEQSMVNVRLHVLKLWTRTGKRFRYDVKSLDDDEILIK